MLRNRSRIVTKQSPTIMADHQTTSSQTTQNPTRPISSFLGSPRFFFSPTSILDTHKQISNFGNNPFQLIKNPEKPTKIFQKFNHKTENFDSEGIALVLIQETSKNGNICNKTNSKKILFGNNLKIKIPSLDPFQTGPPESPGDFGIKTRNSQLSNGPTQIGFGSGFGSGSPKYCTGPLSLKEMELSEEYTRVISHGPNPKTTHIYDNCVVERCCSIRVGSAEPTLESSSVISSCHTCKKNLGEDSDIFMYRGDKAFCSEECRCQEMILDRPSCLNPPKP